MKRVVAGLVAVIVVGAAFLAVMRTLVFLLYQLPEQRLHHLFPQVRWENWDVLSQYIVLALHDPIIHWTGGAAVAILIIRWLLLSLRREHCRRVNLAYERGRLDEIDRRLHRQPIARGK